MPEHETAEVVEGQAEEVGSELAVAPQAPATLFRTDDPAKVLERATETANALKSVLQRQNLTTTIQGREHVRVEGWQTLGAMLGVTPVCTWTRPTGDGDGWEARVEARTLDGRVIGAAEAECLRSESTWKSRDDYALRSMAQTRATSKALASVLRFVVTLAGFDGTPAEEMPRDGGSNGGARQSAPSSSPPVDPLPADRVNKIGKRIGGLNLTYGQIDLMLGACGIDGLRAASGKALRERLESLTTAQADALEAEMERRSS